jgi:hypothetical protein
MRDYLIFIGLIDKIYYHLKKKKKSGGSEVEDMVNVNAVDRVGKKNSIIMIFLLPMDTFWVHVWSPGGGCLRQQPRR